jgi:hypothetical protein
MMVAGFLAQLVPQDGSGNPAVDEVCRRTVWEFFERNLGSGARTNPVWSDRELTTGRQNTIICHPKHLKLFYSETHFDAIDFETEHDLSRDG